jgi:hypothetical protein
MINSYANEFKWFFGIVEDREDPKMLGRVRVRVHNIHTTNKALLPTDMLPWASVIMSPTSAGIKEVGISPTGMMVGSTVFGFFVDGEQMQMPMVLGTIASIPQNDEQQHEVTQLARAKNNIDKAILYPEPEQKYKSKYPYNKVMTTEGGHVIEFDDTPGEERIHIMHKSGSYIEIDAEGTRVDKTVGERYSIVVGDETVRVVGDVDVEVNGNGRLQVDGNVDLVVYGSLDAKIFGESTSVYSSGPITLVGQDDVTVRSAANISVYTPGSASVESLGNLTLRGGSIVIDTPTLTINTGITTATSLGMTTLVANPMNINPV